MSIRNRRQKLDIVSLYHELVYKTLKQSISENMKGKFRGKFNKTIIFILIYVKILNGISIGNTYWKNTDKFVLQMLNQ